MIKLSGKATMDGVAQRLGTAILSIYARQDSPFVPTTFCVDKVVDDNGEYTYREFAEQILGL